MDKKRKKRGAFLGLFRDRELEKKVTQLENTIEVYERDRQDALSPYYVGSTAGKEPKDFAGNAHQMEEMRYLFNNDTITRAFLQKLKVELVGEGVTPIVVSTQKEDSELVRKVEEALTRWSESLSCDYERRLNFVGMQNIAAISVPRDGGCFVRNATDMGSGHLQLQMLGQEFLDLDKNSYGTSGNPICEGVEMLPSGRVVAYWLYETLPGDNSFTRARTRSRRVPVDEISYIYRVDRPHQRVGEPWLAPALSELWDRKKYMSAKIKKKTIQSCFTGIVTDQNMLSQEEREMLDPNQNKVTSIKEGSITTLGPGKNIVFPSVSPDADPTFREDMLKDITSSLGLSYEIFDYSKTSFSSARMGYLGTDRAIRTWHKTVFSPFFYERVGHWFLGSLVKQRYITLDERRRISVRWSPQKRESVDPLKDAQTTVFELQNDLISRKEAASRMGYIFEKNVAEIKESKDYLRENGLFPPEAAPLVQEGATPSDKEVAEEEKLIEEEESAGGSNSPDG